MDYRSFAVAIGVGLLVGVIYGLLNVRSPAPPVIALLGLLGMLIGEQAVAWWRGHVDVSQAVARACTHGEHPPKVACRPEPTEQRS